MDYYTEKAEQANDIPDAQPVTSEYDENEIRVGVLGDVVKRQRAEIAALEAENARLLGCVRELEREALKEPRGFQLTEREFLRQRSIDDRHNACEAGWNGRIDNRR